MSEYEVLNVGTSSARFINMVCGGGNLACGGIDVLCGSVNGGCTAVDDTCSGINGDCGCGSDSNCDGGNVFPCENPGFGCRSGCGGASAMNCPEIMSMG